MTEIPPRPEAPLTIGISQCLLGEEVRYDGSGAKSSFPHAALEGLFEYRGICPEMGIGMGVPRAPIRLVGDPEGIRAVGVKDHTTDFTHQLREFGQRMLPGLKAVSGYVFMKNSPSCGLFRVKVYPHDGTQVTGAPDQQGRGIYAGAVVDGLPDMPVEESGRLNDVILRENFVTRTYAYAHWQLFLSSGLTARGLIAFHSRYKYLLMAHSPSHYQEAGRLLSDLSSELPETAQRYIGILMSGLTKPASRGGHANVLTHLQGYLKRALDGPSRQELASLISRYRLGELPLLAPITMLKHYFRLHPDEYIDYQVYLDPHPQRAGLRRSL